MTYDYLTYTVNPGYYVNSTSTISNVIVTYPNPVVYKPVPTPFPFKAEEAMPRPETDMAWLKRRIKEVSWVPA
jgi:hypothetical protein